MHLLVLLACASGKPSLGDTSNDTSDTSADTGDTSADTADTSAPPCGADVPPADGQLRASNGVFTGAPSGEGWAFLGVPFASPPVGELRFRPTEPPPCDAGPRAATAFAPWCPQWIDASDPKSGLTGDEDCLYLNVWTPTDLPEPAEALPVLLFVHGGGNVAGGTSTSDGGVEMYDGAALADRLGVVVVTTAYRLGALGFLAHPELTEESGGSGNWGLDDVLAALDWTRANAAAFGGDPDRVLLFGQSAGAVDTCALYTSPSAVGLLAGVALQSGGCPATELAEAEALGVEHATAVGCGDAACLRALPWTDLAALSADPISDLGIPGLGGFGPTVDGRRLPLLPKVALETGAHADVPMIVGSTSDESSQWIPSLTEEEYEALVRVTFGRTMSDDVLALYPAATYGSGRAAWIALTTDVTFGCPARTIARSLTESGTAPVYRYQFANVPNGASGAAFGAWHGLDLLFVFQHLDDVVAATGYEADEGDVRVEAGMGEAWAGLADGTMDTLSFDWPEYDATDPVLRFDDPFATELDPRATECDFWDAVAEEG